MSTKYVIVVCGTTGSGKSYSSIEIAKKIGGEIVNSDAFQLYSGPLVVLCISYLTSCRS